MKAPLLIVAAILGLSLAVAACGDSEEEFAPAVTPTPTVSGVTLAEGDASPSAVQTASLPICDAIQTGARTLSPASTRAQAQYSDPTAGYTVWYPANWNPCFDPDSLGIGSGVQFLAEDGFPHAKIYVYPNPDKLSLEEWLQEHDPIFLDKDRMHEERFIAGGRALFNAVDAEGLPTAEAYLDGGSQIFLVSALKIEEFDEFVAQLRLSR